MNLCECGCGKEVLGRFVNGHNGRLPISIEDRGYKTPCHIWQGKIDKDGYPHSGNVRLFRTVYERAKGKIPEGLILDHLCKVRPCINPEHGEPVSGAENVRRGKLPKLSLSQADEIRKRYSAGGITELALAREYGVARRTVSHLICNHSWMEQIK